MIEFTNIPGVLDYARTENGNTWLCQADEDGERHIILIRLDCKAKLWLKIDINTANYPGLHVTTVTAMHPELAAMIIANCSGWTVMKNNIDGVPYYKEHGVVYIGAEE
jgi:hypothetical protein